MIRLGLVGWGNVAEEYDKAIRHIPDFNLVSVLDVQRRKGRSVREAGANFFLPTRYKDFLDSVDSVIIATPHNLHAQQTITALRAGKNVLCEKPMATNLDDAIRMIETATHNKRTLMVASHLRYRPSMQKLIKNPNINGKINNVKVAFLEDVENYTPGEAWLYNKAQSGGGCVIDSGINAFDCLRQVLGRLEIKSAKLGYKGKEGKNLEVETTAEIYFTFSNGCEGRLDVSWISEREVREAEFIGTTGTYKVDWINLELVGAQTDMSQEYINLMRDFRNRLSKKYSVETDGIKALELVMKTYKVAERVS